MEDKNFLKAFYKEHKLLFMIFLSLILQLSILFCWGFDTLQTQSENYLPMSILPNAEPKQEQKPPVKEIVESKDSKDATEEEQQKTSSNKSSSQSENPHFMPFVKVDQIAKALSPLNVVYPAMAKNAGVEGIVILKVYIDSKGFVRKVVVLKGIGFGCDEAAINKVKSIRFIPAKMKGESVAVYQRITFHFKLN